MVLNIFEAVDVITVIKGGVYDDLTLSVGEALLKRSEVCTRAFDQVPSFQFNLANRISLVSIPAPFMIA